MEPPRQVPSGPASSSDSSEPASAAPGFLAPMGSRSEAARPGDFDRVSFDRVCYDYGRRRVLSRVSFDCAAGTITGLLGPNGAGKSTLLAVAATRARPSSGSVRYGDVAGDGGGDSRGDSADKAAASARVSAVEPRVLRSRIGWLGHDPGFYPELSALENLQFFAALHDAPGGAAKGASHFDAALTRAALSDRADDAVGGFSRGMRQRLGLERVLMHDPRLVLLDEPFTGLDDASALALRDRLAGLKASGAIVLLTTHDLDFVSGLLDDAVVLRNGRIVDQFCLAGPAVPGAADAEPSAVAAGVHGAAPGRGLASAETALLERYRRAVSAPGSEPSTAPGDAAAASAEGEASDRAQPAERSPQAGAFAVDGPSSRRRLGVEPSRPGARPRERARHADGEAAASTTLLRARREAPFAGASSAEESVGTAVRRLVRAAGLVARKDLIVEYRSRELFLTTLFFAVSCVLVFAFAFVKEGRPLVDAAAGILWIAIAFAGTLALGRTFEREQASQTLQALLQAPVDRAAIYIGKLLGLLALLAVVEIVVVPLVSLFFQTPLDAAGWLVALLLVLLLATGTIGFLAVGTLFSAMLVRTRSRDVLLPVLLYPMTVPVMLAGVRGTSALLEATPDLIAARMWLSMLVLFDVVFVTLALWTFDAVTSE
jgi:heme exporter protein CcmB